MIIQSLLRICRRRFSVNSSSEGSTKLVTANAIMRAPGSAVKRRACFIKCSQAGTVECRWWHHKEASVRLVPTIVAKSGQQIVLKETIGVLRFTDA